MISVKVLANCRGIPTTDLPVWVHFTERINQAESQFSHFQYRLYCHRLYCVFYGLDPRVEGRTPEFHRSQWSLRLAAVCPK